MKYVGTLNRIEKEILRECASKNLQVNENFLNYYLNLLALDPTWGITGRDLPHRGDVQKFIKYVLNKVENQLTPEMIALRMQYYFMCNFEPRLKMVKRNRTQLLLRLKSLEQEIIDIRMLVEEDEIDTMYKRVVYYITLASGLGNPTLEPVFKEVRASLGSILDHNEIKEFAEQVRYNKIENLAEFTKLVTGIRLFNKDCGKGGEGMEDLPKLINEGLEATNAELQSTLSRIMDKVNLMTTALDYVYETELNERSQYVVFCRLPKGTTVADVEFVRDSLIVYRQYELYIRKLMDEVVHVETISLQIFRTLQKALVELHKVVQHRIAIPVNQVFPHFVKLSDIWCNLQDQTILLAKINQIMNTLLKYIKLLDFHDATAEAMIPDGELPMTDIQRLQRCAGQKISPEDNNALIIDALNFNEQTKLRLEYLGFCAWKIFMTGGALLPGNPNLGVAKTMLLSFAFSSVEAGTAFGRAPEKCVMETITLARRKPALINLLNLQKNMTRLQDVKELVREPPELPLTEDVEIQTEVHPVEKNIDRKYFWNVWDYKRLAIQLSKTSHCKTVSCQTLKSYHRLNLKQQTYNTIDQNVQTRRDNYGNVPKPSTFVFGLRGRKDDKQFIIDMTRSVEE